MTIDKPITPSPDLVQEWATWRPKGGQAHPGMLAIYQQIADKAAEWGYYRCNAEYEFAAMDLCPPPDDFEPDGLDD